MKSLATSSLLALGTWYIGACLSFERGNLPNDVCAYFESRACDRAVRPIINETMGKQKFEE